MRAIAFRIPAGLVHTCCSQRLSWCAICSALGGSAKKGDKLALSGTIESKAGIMAEPDRPFEIEGSGHDDLAQSLSFCGCVPSALVHVLPVASV